ncbi:hypothetical protein [Mucilaginibacter ginkgonis]|uniref:hypothetical protein n=1 Tax=Mucilaginibacter ginkgonis TaxID=2682091 RepID=UPI001FC89550|nr:hypothetical protein [Mucilaginibacter ginkgonis]
MRFVYYEAYNALSRSLPDTSHLQTIYQNIRAAIHPRQYRNSCRLKAGATAGNR